MITFFELISTSAPHIYTSALLLSPKTSTVCKIYSQYAHPLARVVHGLPTSWDPVVATIYNERSPYKAAWSPCNRFTAVAKSEAVDICDAATLNPLSTFRSPPDTKIQALSFSPDGHFLAQFNVGDFVTWDLQTGGSVGIIFPEGLHTRHLNFSSTYSVDGKMIAVVYRGHRSTFIATHNLSTAHAHLYEDPDECIIPPIWTHGEFLQFATLKPGDITIWEVDFTLANKPQVVKSFSTPNEITNRKSHEILFLPANSRLAIALENQLLVWNAQDSQFLLKIPAPARGMTFSSNGHFFGCIFRSNEEYCVWKEGPDGYILHQKLEFHSAGLPITLLLSPNGESVVLPLLSTIHLWHTKDPILSSSPTVVAGLYGHVLGFSPNEPLVAFARSEQKTITILDLQSGDLRLTIDTGIGVEDLGVNGNTIIVISKEEIVTWNLATESARANIGDSIQITKIDRSPPSKGHNFLLLVLSPDLSRIVSEGDALPGLPVDLELYDVSTGRCLASAIQSLGKLKSLSTSHEFKVTHGSKGEDLDWVNFTPDGCEICFVSYDKTSADRWKIIEDSESGTTKLQPLGMTECPPGVLPWQSSSGYVVTDGGWILGPTQKRLLWLPHHWRSHEAFRTWSGQFLGLGNSELPEPVILQFLE